LLGEQNNKKKKQQQKKRQQNKTRKPARIKHAEILNVPNANA